MAQKTRERHAHGNALFERLRGDGLDIKDSYGEPLSDMPLMEPKVTRRGFLRVAAGAVAAMAIGNQAKAEKPVEMDVQTGRPHKLLPGHELRIENHGSKDIVVPIDTKAELRFMGKTVRESTVRDSQGNERTLKRISRVSNKGIDTTLPAKIHDSDPNTMSTDIGVGDTFKLEVGERATFAESADGRKSDVLYLSPGYSMTARTPGEYDIEKSYGVKLIDVDTIEARRQAKAEEERMVRAHKAQIKLRYDTLKPALDKMNGTEKVDGIGGYGRFGVQFRFEQETGAIYIDGLEKNNVHERKVRIAPIGRYDAHVDRPVSSTLVLEAEKSGGGWERLTDPTQPGYPKIGASLLTWTIRDSGIEKKERDERGKIYQREPFRRR